VYNIIEKLQKKKINGVVLEGMVAKYG